MGKKIRFFDEHGNVGYAENPLVIPIDVLGEDGFRVLHSGVTITPQTTTKYIKPRFFSEEVADQLVENEIKRKQADEKVKQMLSGKEYAKLGGLALGGAAAAGGAAYALPAISAYIAPTTIGGNIVGDMAGGLALGTAMEEGQRAAFGQSAGDILYKQAKPYLGNSTVGEFTANMVRPEYWVSPSMLFKGTYNAAQNTLGKQFERNISMPKGEEPSKDILKYSIVSPSRVDKIKKIASDNPDIFTQEASYMPNSDLAILSERYKFTPIYEGNIGRFNKKFDKEILDRLQEMGIDLDSKIFVVPNNNTGRILTTPREFMRHSPNSVYYGLFEGSKIGGAHFPNNGLVMIDPTVTNGLLAAIHEVNGHRRFPIIEALIDKGAMKPYSNVMDTLDDGIRNSTINSQSLNELRSTLLEVQRKIMYPIYKNNNKPSDLATIREAYRKAVDDLSIDDLKKYVSTINAYGNEYAKYATDKTWGAVRDALKYGPVVATPLLLNNTENKK